MGRSGYGLFIGTLYFILSSLTRYRSFCMELSIELKCFQKTHQKKTSNISCIQHTVVLYHAHDQNKNYRFQTQWYCFVDKFHVIFEVVCNQHISSG